MEYKFRSFDKGEEIREMIYSDRKNDGDYWFTLDDGVVQCLADCCYCDSFGDNHDDWQPLDNVMMYTGFKDKNGTEIYEGDILHRDGFWDIQVEWDRGCFMTRDTDKVRRNNLCLDKEIRLFPIEEWEVIGNIYENPELLEG